MSGRLGRNLLDTHPGLLEERPALAGGERLVGELGGRIVAALDIRSGRVDADPFVVTRGVVELLGLRAMQVRR